MTRICLTMIVKDESPVIARCLESARDWIDYWVIVDTGSTDNTKDLVRAMLAEVPGELIERPWVNFAHNRQEVLDAAQATRHLNHVDYALWLDADEVFTNPPAKGELDLDLDGYFLPVDYDGMSYSRLALTNLDKPWQWIGPVHEYLDLPGAVSGNLTSPGVLVRHDGARSRDPETYVKDGLLLAAALTKDPDNTRLTFYYAQSLRDGGRAFDAREAYQRRAEMGGWDQEVFVSLLEVARLTERIGEPATDAYLTAANFMPDRAEAWVELARLERERDRFAIGMLYAEEAVSLSMPGPEGLFVDTACYTWRAWDELAINAWWAGHHEEARDSAETALSHNPTEQRLIDNLRLCGG